MSERPKPIPIDASFQDNFSPTIDFLEDDLELFVNLQYEIFLIEKDSPALPPLPLLATSDPVKRWKHVPIIARQSSIRRVRFSECWPICHMNTVDVVKVMLLFNFE